MTCLRKINYFSFSCINTALQKTESNEPSVKPAGVKPASMYFQFLSPVLQNAQD